MANTQASLVTIKIDQTQLAGVKSMLKDIKNGAELALRNALNKTVDGCVTDSAKAVYGEINLTQTRIKKDIGSKKATLNNLNAMVYSKGDKIELIEYGARQVKQGVTFQVKRSGGRTSMHYGFIAIGRRDNKPHVMHRDRAKTGTGKPIGVPKAGYLYGFPVYWPEHPYRYPSYKVYGPSIPDIMGKDAIFKDIEDKATDRLVKRLDEEANYVLLKSQGLA